MLFLPTHRGLHREKRNSKSSEKYGRSEGESDSRGNCEEGGSHSIALVTGCSSKVGRSICNFLHSGYEVVKHEGKKDGDLSSNLSFFQTISQVDLLVCCAGGVKVGGKEPALQIADILLVCKAEIFLT